MRHLIFSRTRSFKPRLNGKARLCQQFWYWVILWLPIFVYAAQTPSIAFYYAEQPPIVELAQFDRVVVQPHHTQAKEIEQFHQLGVELYAYISIGEMSRAHYLAEQLRPEWIVGANPDWDSHILDLTHSGWQQMLGERIQTLLKRGFDGVFLDTLDSYMRVFEGAAAQSQQQALASLIARFANEKPGPKILLNRGFEILPQVHQFIDGVVAESLVGTWESGGYGMVAADTTEALTPILREVANRYRLPVYVIDYADPADTEKTAKIATRIKALGFVPWVASRHLDSLGVGQLRVVPRRLLAIYNGNTPRIDANVTRYLAPVADYLGYRLDYTEISETLPSKPLKGLYAGVIVWVDPLEEHDQRTLHAWLSQQIDANVPALIMGNSGLETSALATRLGLSTHAESARGTVSIAIQDDSIGRFEAPVRPRRRGLTLLTNDSPDNRVLLSFRDESGRNFDPIVIGPWGGVVSYPYIFEEGFEDNQWLIDPFAVMTQALNLSQIPVPDVTTENGQRVLLIHIDGDGFINRADVSETPFSAEVIAQQFLRHYPFKSTVSVIEGELIPQGTAGKNSDEAEALARQIFQLDNVELASHTYSHPYFWDAFEKPTTDRKALYGDHISIRGYEKLDLQREIHGSVRYINERLAPPGKSVEVFLWSGDASPSAKAVGLVAKLGLRNLNGGNTTLTNARSTLMRVTGSVVPLGDHLQILAPVMNENDFTNLWTEPLYGYEKVIQTFQLTESPRRLKPINIYYHFYSGEKMASRVALHRVYDWAVGQRPVSLYASEYADRASAAYHSSIGQLDDGRWQVRAQGPLRTVRLAKSLGAPNMTESNNVAGFDTINGEHYVHLTDARAVVVTDGQHESLPYLRRSNGQVSMWLRRATGVIELELKAAQSLFFDIHSASPCQLTTDDREIRGKRRGDILHFNFDAPNVRGLLDCSHP